MITTRKDVIVGILNDTYGTSDFAKSVNSDIADLLLDRYDNGTDYDWGVRQLTQDDFINIIWMNWSGGSTAEHTAKRIIDALELKFDKADIKFDQDRGAL